MTPPGTGEVTAHAGDTWPGAPCFGVQRLWNSSDPAGCCCAQMWFSLTSSFAYLRKIGHPDSYMKPNVQNVIKE